MPNFLIIGAAKAGTTSLYCYLKQHPEIFMSHIKEPNFFCFEGKTLNFKAPGDRDEPINHTSVTNLDSYKALFKDVVAEKAIGCASPIYLYHSKAPERIKFYIPDVKLIAILRHPVDRAHSAFTFQYLGGVESGVKCLTDFAEAFYNEDIYIQENWMPLYHFKSSGFYYAQLQRYYNLFNPNQIKVYLYEDLIVHPLAVVQDIFRFLEVDESFIPDMSGEANISGIPKNEGLYKFYTLLSKQKLVKLTLKSFLPKGVGQRFKKFILAKPQLSPKLRRELTEVYREDILKLQQLISRDLSHWLA
jgi:hypothetical protein